MDHDRVVVVDVSLAMAVIGCKDCGAAEEREDQNQRSYTMTHSNILSSDFGLGRAVRQSDCQEMRVAKSLITKVRLERVAVTDGSTAGEKSEADP
jgi:hypothetical protein